MTEADAAGVQLVALANGQPADGSAAELRYQQHIRSRGAMAVALDDAGRVIGFGGSVLIDGASMLTDLFVDPSRHGLGVGRALLEMVWPAPTVKRYTFSSTHRHALSLYARSGASPVWPLLYLRGPEWEGHNGAGGLPATRLAAVCAPTDVAAGTELELTGADRSPDYAYWCGTPRATGGVVVYEDDDPVAAAAVSERRVEHMGVAAGRGDRLAAEAVLAVLSLLDRPSVEICLPGPHPALRTLLESGYRIDDFDICMTTSADLVVADWAYSPALA